MPKMVDYKERCRHYKSRIIRLSSILKKQEQIFKEIEHRQKLNNAEREERFYRLLDLTKEQEKLIFDLETQLDSLFPKMYPELYIGEIK